jgi:hypothetical protein
MFIELIKDLINLFNLNNYYENIFEFNYYINENDF